MTAINTRTRGERVPLTDGSGRWFDPATCMVWDEETRWDGRNMVSLATGDQWEHERLHRTPGGRWVLHHWSQWQGTTPSYTEVDRETAAAWLVRNGYDPHPDLVEAIERLQLGQGLAEYALLLSLVAMVAILALIFLGSQVSRLLSTVGTSV
jgi:Flp pilus assembly pilin Flp